MKSIVLAALTVLTPIAAPGQEPPAKSPTVRELVQRYLEALGGPAAREKLTSRVTRGTATVVDRGAVGSTTIYQKAPAFYLMVSEFPNYGTTRRAFDGERGWAESPDAGLADLAGPRLVQMRRLAQFDHDARVESLYPGLTVVGQEALDGAAAWTVRSVDGETSDTLYFDAATGLLVGAVHEEPTPSGPARLETRYGDFRTVDGVKVAFFTRIRTPRSTLEMKVESVQHNQPIDDALFQRPSTVQE
jgi:hypothetical protein